MDMPPALPPAAEAMDMPPSPAESMVMQPPTQPPETNEKENDMPHNYDPAKYKDVVELINYIKEPTCFDDLARRLVRVACRNEEPLNLVNDSVLNEVISRRKSRLAVAIIDLPHDLNRDILRHKNHYGDTALHIAAMEGDVTVAKALLGVYLQEKKDDACSEYLAGKRRVCGSLAIEKNRIGETALHKAVLYGHFDVFYSIIEVVGKENANDRTDDGSTILHYAIMGNQPKEALKFAFDFPGMILSRNIKGATPLQIMVSFFKKPSETGIFESLFQHFTLGKAATSTKTGKTDEESGSSENEIAGTWWSRLLGNKIEKLREEKSKYETTMELLEFLALPKTKDNKQLNEGLGFYFKGFNKNTINTSQKNTRIWEESPLITGVKLGFDDFVIKILKVCPQSATYVGYDGMNVLQAAVKYDRRRVVNAIKNDDRMLSWLFTQLESRTKNTLLHIAATDKKTLNETDPLRLQDELKGFEMLEKMVPKELLNYRNEEEKTAREVFEEQHEKTLKLCTKELAGIGKACSPLVAAVVFTSSFFIPSENNRDRNRLAFKIFSHGYVLAFSFSATSLVMFLLLVVTPFKQRDFRRVVPWHYLTACFLLAMSLAAFIVAFTCNMYLQIYGKQRESHAELATLLLELLFVPFLCFLGYFLSGASSRLGSLFGRLK